MLRDGGRGGTSSLVQACVVAICRWAVVPRRAAEVCSAARAASAADTGRAELCLKVCARARVLAVVGRRTMSTAQVSKINKHILNNLKTKYVITITCKDKTIFDNYKSIAIKKIFNLNNVKITVFKVI